MGQSWNTSARIFFFLLVAMALPGGCREKPGSSASTAPSGESRTKVASLVPAATDLILGMGAGDRLVAISNQEPAEFASKSLPRVGDYQATDWEMLAELKPQVMIIQIDPAHLPEGFTQKAATLKIQLINIRLNTLEDLLEGSRQIGRAIGEPQKGEALSTQLRSRLDAIQKKWAGQPRIKTLLTLDETAENIVGAPTFLDDLLRIAGGQNAGASLNAPWPRIDHESLLSLKPKVVIQLKPNAKPGTLDRAKSFWARLGGDDGTAPGIYLLSDSYVLLPGAHVADVAEAMERCLHPKIEAKP